MSFTVSSYGEALDYLYKRLPMFSRVGSAAFRADLDNIRALCAALDHPEQHFKSIHIAGTNGKGSVSHMLAAVCQTAGYRTGLYTSPHLKDFRERIRIDGTMIPREAVVDFVNRLLPMMEALQPSFFEITVAMAFAHFARERVDVAIIETGLGGRLDSTNIILPELSVITNISLDHQDILGHTLPEIAGEKAGIIKPGIPVVIGETQPETAPVFRETARRLGSPLRFADQEWQLHRQALQQGEPRYYFRGKDGADHILEPDLGGAYQSKNLCTLLAACTLLEERGWGLTLPVIQQGIKQVRAVTGLRGRWEIAGYRPLTVFDVAHNEGGIREIVAQLSHTSYRQLHVVMGFVKDKTVGHILTLLPRNAVYYFCRAALPRAMDEKVLQAQAAAAGLQGEAWPGVQEAFRAAQRRAGPEDMILVCGSFFVVGEVLPEEGSAGRLQPAQP
ncbi:folylpolyglutamate synthase/dihydrofolate synthase family protein [Compostibacter hankyongensis]|uniref:Dihydrofolate synthase/folylpolyglutamate synthase n=1 Tax=Compostibacter hankyongensis TaxID=1007089 RepID=A0ABP8FNY1_9BACT